MVNLTFALVGVFLSLGSASVSAAPKWLAFGDIRGYFEPCGCDPLTDLGGIQRIQAHLAREKFSNPDVSIFNLGNSFSLETFALAQQKNTYIRAGLNVIGADVTLLNRTELTVPDHFLPGLNYVLSNHKPNTAGRTGFKSMIETNGFLVFGLVEPFKGYPHLMPFDANKWRQLKAKELKFSTLKSVLLYSGSVKTLKKIVNTKIFDFIISSNDLGLEKTIAGEEQQNPSQLIRLRSGNVEVLKTPAGGQGVIRSPEMEQKPAALPLALTLDPNKNEPKDLTRKYVYWLTKADDEGLSKDMEAVVAKFRGASSQKMQSLVAERELNLKDSKFAGVSACVPCHSKAVEIWNTTKHAHAFQTILDKNRTSDPECVSCHVVGFSEKGGFVSQEKSPHLNNVQCESCHGPRKDHVANPGGKSERMMAKKTCIGCHTPPHSPGFDAKKYWEIIKH